MALRIVEQAGQTDVGRQRTANEDSLLLRPPLFAVADGMGGARAGEVASRWRSRSSSDGPTASPPRSGSPVAAAANRRIYELAEADESRRGMGTTLTPRWCTATR